MTTKIIPGSEADALITALTRSADALETMAGSATTANFIREDSSRYLCETIASLRDRQPKSPARGRGRA